MILDKPAKTNAQLLGTDIIRGSPIMGPVVSLVTGAVQMSISLDEPDCGHPTFLPGLVVAQQTLHAALRQSVQSICHRGGGGGGGGVGDKPIPTPPVPCWPRPQMLQSAFAGEQRLDASLTVAGEMWGRGGGGGFNKGQQIRQPLPDPTNLGLAQVDCSIAYIGTMHKHGLQSA